ncbi:MAG TPA: hypothetical protein VMM78_05595 [Thermomicrobiales bacterium]|nr:hypothetical protein [Thermomicrobiales bacterium]
MLHGGGPLPGPPREMLRCQWCSVPLKPGVTLCPTCGSPGVPDPVFSTPEPEPAPAVDALSVTVFDETSVIAPWRDDESLVVDAPVTGSRKQLTVQEAENRQMQTIKLAVIAVLVCGFLGWLAGPLLAGVIESFTGTPVEDSGDLRPMGGFFGMLTGLLVGGIGGVVIWSGR